MKGYRPSRVTIIVVCCAVATISIISFLLLTLLQPGTDNHKRAPTTSAGVTAIVGVSTGTTTANTPTTTPIVKGTSVPIVKGTSTLTPTPTATPTPDPDPTSFTISVAGGGRLDLFGTVGQQGTLPSQSINVDYPDPNSPRKSPPPGPITWSISATPQGNPIGNWLTLSPNSGTIHYGDPEQKIIVTASVLPSMQANITYTMNIQVTPNQTINFGIITLTLSAPAPTPAHLGVSPTSLTFSNEASGATDSQAVSVSNSGGEPMTWSAQTDGSSWLSIDNMGGTINLGGSNTINIMVNTTGLTAGQTYTGSVTISATNAGGSPVIVGITLSMA